MNQYQQLSEKLSALESREKQLITWVSFALIIYLFFLNFGIILCPLSFRNFLF